MGGRGECCRRQREMRGVGAVLHELVFPNQKEQAATFLKRPFQCANGINAVVRSGSPRSACAFLVVKNEFPWRLKQRSQEGLFTRGRQRCHGITMEVRRDRLSGLMRRHIRRHKINSLQPAPLPRRVCERKMTSVYGIESAAEKADIHAGKLFQVVVKHSLPPPRRAGPDLPCLPSRISTSQSRRQ